MDSSEYLWDRIHKGDDTELDLEFPGEVPESIAYHAPCHLRAQNVGLKSRDLLKKTGAKISVVAECSAIDGTWGLRDENYDTARKYSGKLGRALEKADAEAIAGDCNLANGGIVEEVGQRPSHPMETAGPGLRHRRPRAEDRHMTRALQLSDIVDVRAYERTRDDYRRQIIELKKRRRVSVGPFVTLLFESRETIRFQIQEMARVEKLVSDEAIEGELRAYNPLIPEPGCLSATLFIELTSDEGLREWLPKLVGIERSVELVFGDTVVPCIPEAGHERAAHPRRGHRSGALHPVGARPAQVEQFAAEPVTLRVHHPDYDETQALSAETVAELLGDLRA